MSLDQDWDRAAPAGTPSLTSDWEKAKPVKIPTTKVKADAAAPESPTSAKNLAGAAVEPMLSMGTGAIAGPASGLAGIAGAVAPGPPGQGADWARRVSENFTYAPRTQGGRNALGAFSYPFEKIGQGAHAAGERISDATGSPALGAGATTAIESLPQFIGARGMSLLKPPPAAKPRGSPGVQELARRGVSMTPGQIAGGGWGRAEEALGNVPIVGSPIKAARERGVDDFNRAGWNDALAPIGKELPKNLKGSDAAQHVRETLSAEYEALLPKMKGTLDNRPPKNALPAPGQLGQPPRPTLRQDLDNLLAIAKQPGGLPPREMRQLRRIIDKEIKEKFDQPGAMATGERLKKIRETLRTEEQNFRTGGPYERMLADAIKEADASVRRMVEDVNPQHAKQLRNIDDGYARFKIAQQAAGSQGAKEGIFTPSQYDRAVRSKDKSKDKRAYSEGAARQQDLSTAGKNVLSDKQRDSGTPAQLAVLEALLGGGGHLIGGPGTIAAMMAAPLAYSRPGLNMWQRLMLNPPEFGRGAGMALPVGAGQLPQPPQ